MTKKRVFVAINLPEDIKDRLEKEVEYLQTQYGPEVRFTTRPNWHLTITFLGYQDDNEINLASGAIAEAAAVFDSPEVRFEKIVYGPVGRTPRMIWLVGDKATSVALGRIKDALEKRLFEAGVRFEQEHRGYTAHLTLARFPAVSREDLPLLETEFKNSFTAGSLDLMESHLKRSGAEYEKLSAFEFSAD